MDYGTLIAAKTVSGSIKSWVNHDDVPSAQCVTLAESLIYSRLRAREMLVVRADVIALNATTLALPSDYLETLSFRRIGDNAGKIRVLDPQHFEERLAFDSANALEAGVPTEAAVGGTSFFFNTKNDTTNLPYRLWYYGRPTALATAGSNWLTNRYEAILHAITLHYGFAFRKDGIEAEKWLAAGAAHIAQANVENDLHNASVSFEHDWQNR